MNDIRASIYEHIARTASIDVSSVRPTTTIKELGIPSLDTIEMLFQIEEEFDVRLADSDVNIATATAADLVTAIEHALERKSAPVAVPAGSVA